MIIFGSFLILIFLFSLISQRVDNTMITGPIVFTLGGILIFLAVPTIAEKGIEEKSILTIGEITLALLLFSESLHLSPRKILRESQLPVRLLGIGMPLLIFLGAITAALILTDLSIWEAAILGAILAPTDASLGIAVVNSKRVPERIRDALKIEGGLNDGLSIPFLMLFIALAQVQAPGEQPSWLAYTFQQIGFGILVGIVLGWMGGQLISITIEKEWMEGSARQLAMLSLAILSWGVAEKVIGGNGFIAAFIAGGMVRLVDETARQHIANFNKAWGDLLIYFVFFLFGMLAAPQLGKFTAPFWLYAILSLTLVRMLPVAISMIGTRLKTSTVLFLGWFGPRGLASVVLGLIFLEEKASLPGEPTIVLAVIATVLLSVFVHGISAAPGIKIYQRTLSTLDSQAPEYQETAGMKG
jgi:NhaP-type Na+/H+ or K+/H+ antiporter